MDTRRGRECGAVIRTVNAHLASGKGDVATDVSVETLAELPRLDGSHVGPQVIADTLGKHGVVVVENLASPELMDRVVMELDGKGVFYGAPGSFARNDTSRNAAKPLGESKAVQELAIHEKVVAAIQERLLPWCKKIVLGTCSAITVEPPPPGEEPADHQVLHRDDGMWAASGWPVGGTRPDLSVSVMWAVTDFTEGNGATRIVPGSHAMDREAEISEEMTRRAAMPKGSAMLWLGATAHGASAVTGSSHTEGQRKGFVYLDVYQIAN
jgi:ectoine hydroxylase-related dioxygenase (phytanoyl-CoA dioxygenase family)